MKKIIDGRVYDTENGIGLGYYTNFLSYNDFGYWNAKLYRTPRSGYYFLVGEGGPMTRFGKNCSDGTITFGERLIPLSREAAFEWAQKYLNVNTVLEEFPDLVDMESIMRIKADKATRPPVPNYNGKWVKHRDAITAVIPRKLTKAIVICSCGKEMEVEKNPKNYIETTCECGERVCIFWEDWDGVY